MILTTSTKLCYLKFAAGTMLACFLVSGNATMRQAPADTGSLEKIIGSASEPPHPGNLPAPAIQLCEKLVSHKERLSVKPVARPPFMRRYKEPGFNTINQRITKSRPGQVYKPAGNPAPAWNADESFLLLHRYDEDNSHHAMLLNGQTYEEQGELNIKSRSPEDIYWSTTHPDLLYFVSNDGQQTGDLVAFNIKSGLSNSLKSFDPICEDAGFTGRNSRLVKSLGTDDVFSYLCGSDSDRSLALGYRVSSDELYSLAVGGNSKWPHDVPPIPSYNGQHFLLAGYPFNAKLQPSKTALDLGDPDNPTTMGINAENIDVVYHSSTARAPRGCGNDIWNGIGLLTEHNLDDSSCIAHITQTDGYPNSLSGSQMFASAVHLPKWIAMSSIGYDNFEWFSRKSAAPLLFSEIYIINTHDMEDIELCRLAHHRTFGKAAKNAEYLPERGEPNITLSPNASRVLYSSDWYDSGSVDTYVIELPAFTRINLDGIWVDLDNTNMITEFSQAGEKVLFSRSLRTTDNSSSINTSGSGVIKDNRVTLEYTVFVSEARQVNGNCSANTAAGASSILFECADNYFGRLRFTLKRP